MELDKIFTLIFLLHATNFHGDTNAVVQCKKSNDCVSYGDCPPFLEAFKENENEALFKMRKFRCGHDKQNTVKVCCSAFVNSAPGKPQFEPRVATRKLPSRIIPKRLIFKGHRVQLYEHPWMAIISHNNSGELSFQCSGSIINERYILTAAHCVQNKHIAGVRIGNLDYREDSDCEYMNEQYICETTRRDMGVESSFIHPDYVSSKSGNDIALLRLNEEIEYTDTISPVCLPVTRELRKMNLLGKHVTIAGWGLTETSLPSTYLKKALVPVKQCEDEVPRKTICAGDGYHDTCSGDSGGPLILQVTYDMARFVQFGVVSYGPRMCAKSGPGVYTDVREFVDWILEVITNN